MKISFLTQYYLPEVKAPAIRISEVSRKLIARGHVVKVLTPIPYRSQGEKVSAVEKQITYSSAEDGVEVKRIGVFDRTNPRYYFGRLIRELSFSVNAIMFERRYLVDSDVVVIQSPPLFSGLLSLVYRFAIQGKVIIWCSDIWPDLLVELGVFTKRGITFQLLRAIQKISLRIADGVAVTTAKSVEQITSKYKVREVFLWRNGVDTTFFSPHKPSYDYREHWGLEETDFLIGYAGLHGEFQDLDIVLDTAQRIREKRIKFVLVGDGPRKEEIALKVSREKIDNVVLVPSIRRSLMPSLLQTFNVLFIPLAKPMPTTIPSKFYEAVASGKPVIVVRDSEITQIVEEHKLGCVYKSGDVGSLVSAALNLAAEDKSVLLEMGRRARLLSQRYDRAEVVNKMERDMNSLVGN